MEIVTAKKEDLEIVRKITGSTIKSIYPRYYPAGAVEFFLAHHSDEHIVADISDGKVFLLFENGVSVATVTVSANNINRLFVLPEFQHRGYGKPGLILQRRRYWKFMNVFRSMHHFRQSGFI